MDCCAEIDSLLELCTSVPEVTPSLLGQWVFSHGGPACLDRSDGFSTVRNVLIEWDLEHCIAAALDEHARLVAENEASISIPHVRTNSKSPLAEGSESAGNVGDYVVDTCNINGAANSSVCDLEIVPSAINHSDSASLDPHASATTIPETNACTTDDSVADTSEKCPVTREKYNLFESKILSASSEAAIARLDAFPCANCHRKDAAATLRDVCQKAGRRSDSSRSGDRGRATVVTHLGGSAGWWVQRVEMQTETTWWGQDGRLQTKRERQWHADSKWCAHRGSSAPGAAAESEQSIPSLELMAGEHVVEVEQFIVPANRADRTKQQPRRGVVSVKVAVVESPFNGSLLSPKECLDPGQEFDFDQVEMGTLTVGGRVHDNVLHYRRAGGDAGWVPNFDASSGTTTSFATTFKDSSSIDLSLVAEKAPDPASSLPSSPPSASETQEVVREVVSPVTPHPSTVLLHSTVRSHLNRPAPNLGASLHFYTSRGACFSLVGRGNRETCFEVNWRAEAAAAAALNEKKATASTTTADKDALRTEKSGAAERGQDDTSPKLGTSTSSGSTTITQVSLSAWLGVTLADNGRINAVAPGSSAAHACIKPGCRLRAVLPGGRGGANFRHTATRLSGCGESLHKGSNNNNTIKKFTKVFSRSLRSATGTGSNSASNITNLPASIPVSTATEVVEAVARCTDAGCFKAVVQVAEYPFTNKELRRLRLTAPSGCGVIGLQFDQGQLTGLLTTPTIGKETASSSESLMVSRGTGKHERVCSQCGGHRARAFGDFYRDVAATAPGAAGLRSQSSKPSNFVVVDGVWTPPLGAAAATAEAIRWYEIAAEAGDLDARPELSALLSKRRPRKPSK